MLTCGRLAIGLPIFERIFPPNAHLLFMAIGSNRESILFRSRRLPHHHCVGQATFLTWRLHGSLPPNRNFSPSIPSGQAFLAMDRLLDIGCAGPHYLQNPLIAEMVSAAIYHRDQRVYQLHSFVVMPNHVHLLITPLEAVSKVMQSLKRFTHQASKPDAGTHWPTLLAGRKLRSSGS